MCFYINTYKEDSRDSQQLIKVTDITFKINEKITNIVIQNRNQKMLKTS